jgi:hypothetical protein
MVRPIELPTMGQSAITINKVWCSFCPKEAMPRDGEGLFFILIIPNFKDRNWFIFNKILLYFIKFLIHSTSNYNIFNRTIILLRIPQFK